MSEPNRSPLASLMLFMVCLSIAGSVLAGAHYYAVDLPQQAKAVAPANSACQQCYDDCARNDPDSLECKGYCMMWVCNNNE